MCQMLSGSLLLLEITSLEFTCAISGLVTHSHAEKQHVDFWWGGIHEGGVRRQAAFWQFTERDLIFGKPFLDGFSIFNDDYYRPGTPSKIPCNI